MRRRKLDDALDDWEQVCEGFSRTCLGLEKGVRVFGKELGDGRFLNCGRGAKGEFGEKMGG